MAALIRICFLLIFSSIVSLGQTFEGKVTYQNTYKSKIPNVTDDLLTAMMGTSQEFNFKGGNYQIGFKRNIFTMATLSPKGQ